MKSYSYSIISDFYQCPRLYQLKHIDGVNLQDPSVDTEAGTALHMGVNAILNGESEDFALKLARMYFDTVKEKDLKRFSYSWEELDSCIAVWLSKFTKYQAKHFKPFLMEERLYGKVGEHQFEGTPDFVGWYKGVPSIVDFKTSTKRWEAEKCLSDDQLAGYAELILQTKDFKVEQGVHLVFVKDRKEPSIQNPIISDLTNVAKCSKLDNMKDQMSDITNRECFPKNTRNCIRGPLVCPAFEICHGERKLK